MKNIFKCLFAFSFIFAVSCDDVEPTMYNQESAGTFLSFSSNIYTLPIVINDTGEVEIVLNSSSISSVDRVYNLEILDTTTADPATFTLPSTITIPANSYQGTLILTGQDNGLVDSNAKQLVFKISNLTNESMDAEVITVNVVEVCPLDDEFTGTYVITQLTAGLPVVAGGAPVLGSGTVVQIRETSTFERAFSAPVYPAAGNFGEVEVRFNLSCGNTVLSRLIDTGIYCTQGNNIKWDVATVPSTYDNTNDASFQLTITEEASASCVAPRQTILRFTKQP